MNEIKYFRIGVRHDNQHLLDNKIKDSAFSNSLAAFKAIHKHYRFDPNELIKNHRLLGILHSETWKNCFNCYDYYILNPDTNESIMGGYYVLSNDIQEIVYAADTVTFKCGINVQFIRATKKFIPEVKIEGVPYAASKRIVNEIERSPTFFVFHKNVRGVIEYYIKEKMDENNTDENLIRTEITHSIQIVEHKILLMDADDV